MGVASSTEEDVDVLLSHGKVDAGTTTLLLWKCRRDPRLVAAAASWLETHCDARQTFDDVELFLPQLAHMLVHVDVDWAAGNLERFALVVAQQSPHLALQLYWILSAALDDYAPRDGKGGDEIYYRRCAHAIEDIESVVAFGSARSYELEALFQSGAIGRDELETRTRRTSLKFASSLVNAALRPILRAGDGGTKVSLVDPSLVPHRQAVYEGAVEWCRPSTCCRPPWVAAVAKIESRCLLVYRGRLVAAARLEGAHVVSDDAADFIVRPRNAPSIRLRAANRAEWMRKLTAEASRLPRPPPGASPDMDHASQRRFEFYQNEKRFVEDLANVAETLRQRPRELRQAGLNECLSRVKVPTLGYLPLCKSTDKWRTVLSIVSDEGAVFNTKERCPCLVFFETAYEPGFEGMDVANVIHSFVHGSLSYEEEKKEPVSLWRPETPNTTMSPLRRHELPEISKSQATRTHRRASRVLDFWLTPSHAPVFERSESTESYGQGFREKAAKIRSRARDAHDSWALRALIVKSNDDLRQEVFVAQLVSRYAKLFNQHPNLYLRPYRIVALSASTGCIELVPDSTSLDKLYARPDFVSLKTHFERLYGDDIEAARSRFIAAAAASAFVTYVLAVKDRHNGNILLDANARLVHIDFGFCLGHATGGAFSLERAPFKLTPDMVELMGGLQAFTDAFADALVHARAIVDEVATLIDIMQFKSRFPCFQHGDAVHAFRKRHFLHLAEPALRRKAASLVHQSIDHTGTYLYDLFQYKTQGIAFSSK